MSECVPVQMKTCNSLGEKQKNYGGVQECCTRHVTVVEGVWYVASNTPKPPERSQGALGWQEVRLCDVNL